MKTTNTCSRGCGWRGGGSDCQPDGGGQNGPGAIKPHEFGFPHASNHPDAPGCWGGPAGTALENRTKTAKSTALERLGSERPKTAIRFDPGGQQLSRQTRANPGVFAGRHRPKRAYYEEELAEGMRFELTVRIDSVRRFSKPLPSATRPPLRREKSQTRANPDTAFASPV
jgi:hypothetical protein